MAKEQRNGSGATAKWLTILGAVALIGGWVWNAATISSAVKTNCDEDMKVHSEVKSDVRKNSDDILELKGDVKHILETVNRIEEKL